MLDGGDNSTVVTFPRISVAVAVSWGAGSDYGTRRPTGGEHDSVAATEERTMCSLSSGATLDGAAARLMLLYA